MNFNELNDALKHSSRFTATYRIVAGDYAEAKKSPAASVEQTVECPDKLFVNTWIEDTVIGQIEDLKKRTPAPTTPSSPTVPTPSKEK